MVVAKWLERQSRYLEVLSLNPPGAKALLSLLQSTAVSFIRSLKRGASVLFFLFPIIPLAVTRGAAGLNIQSEDKKYSYLWIPYKSTDNIRYFNQETTALPHICVSIWPAKAISPS